MMRGLFAYCGGAGNKDVTSIDVPSLNEKAFKRQNSSPSLFEMR